MSRSVIRKTTTSAFCTCDANGWRLDMEKLHVRARSISERASIKTLVHVQNLEHSVYMP